MRTVLAALALALLLAYQAFEMYGDRFFESFTLPINEEAGWILFAWALCVYLVIEGLYSAFVATRRSEPTAPVGEAVESAAETRPANASRSLEKELKSAEDMIAALKVKLKDSEESRERADAESNSLREKAAKLERLVEGRDRDAMVDAEIINLLAVLQEKGRFVDFVMEDITPFEDLQVGAAARVVHQGCREVMSEFFRIDAVHSGAEGDALTLESGFSSDQYRLTGNVPDSGPYSGKVMHKGWKASDIKLPRLMQRAEPEARAKNIIAPAQVEI